MPPAATSGGAPPSAPAATGGNGKKGKKGNKKKGNAKTNVKKLNKKKNGKKQRQLQRAATSSRTNNGNKTGTAPESKNTGTAQASSSATTLTNSEGPRAGAPRYHFVEVGVQEPPGARNKSGPQQTRAPRQPSSLARLLTPSAARAEQIRDALEHLQTLIVGHLGLTYYLKPQGSYAQNLLLPDSDLDLVLCSTDEPLVGKAKAVRWLQNLAGWFRRSGNSKYHTRNKNDPFVMEQCIFQARIPIMKLKYLGSTSCKNSSSTSAVPGPLDIDISSGDDRRGTCDKILDEVVEGLERKYDCQSSRLSSSSSSCSSSAFSVRLFLRFLKAFAGEKGLNVTWERGLSNFSWVLLGVIYLQQRTRPNVGGEKELREIFFGFVDWFCTELLPDHVEKGRWLRVEYETKRKKKSDPIGRRSERAGEEDDEPDDSDDCSSAPPKYKKRSVYDPVLGTVVSVYEEEGHNLQRGYFVNTGNNGRRGRGGGPQGGNDASPLLIQVPGADEGENAARCLGPRVWEEKIVPILQRTYAEMDGRGRGGSSGSSSSSSSTSCSSSPPWWAQFLGKDYLSTTTDQTLASSIASAPMLGDTAGGRAGTAAPVPNRTSEDKTSFHRTATGSTTASSSSSSGQEEVIALPDSDDDEENKMKDGASSSTSSSEASSSSSPRHRLAATDWMKSVRRKTTSDRTSESAFAELVSQKGNRASSSESESDSDDGVLDAEREKAAAEERKQRAVKSGNRMLYGDERLVEVRNLLSKKPKPPAQMKKNNRRRKKVKKQGT